MFVKGLTTVAAPFLQASLAHNLGSIYRIARSSEFTQALSHTFRSHDMKSPASQNTESQNTVDLQNAAEIVEQDWSAELSRYHAGARPQPHPSHWHLAMTRLPTLAPALSHGDAHVLVNEVVDQSTSEALATGAEEAALSLADFAAGHIDFDTLDLQLKHFEFKMNLELMDRPSGQRLEDEQRLAFSQQLMPMAFSPLNFVLEHCDSSKARMLEAGLQTLQARTLA